MHPVACAGCCREGRGQAGAGQGAQHGLGEHEQCLGRVLGVDLGPIAAAGLPHPGRCWRGGESSLTKDLSPPQSLGSVKDCASRALCPHQASRVHELLHLQVLTNVCCSLQCSLMCWRKVGVQLQCFLECKLQHALQICMRQRPDVRAQVIDFASAVHCTLP